MTDTEQKRINAICKVAHVDDISDLSDGYHTFRQLYYQRMMLFAAIVKQNHDKAWKSLRHADGELCFGGGWFIVGIDTPEGSYTYHYEDTYFRLFDCEELERGKKWDGHTEKDVTRLLSLEQQPCDDCISRQQAIDAIDALYLAGDSPTSFRANADGDALIGKYQAITALDDLPSVTPQPKMGKWKAFTHSAYHGNDEDGEPIWREVTVYHCDLCNRRTVIKEKYCPNCGHKMQEVEE